MEVDDEGVKSSGGEEEDSPGISPPSSTEDAKENNGEYIINAYRT